MAEQVKPPVKSAGEAFFESAVMRSGQRFEERRLRAGIRQKVEGERGRKTREGQYDADLVEVDADVLTEDDVKIYGLVRSRMHEKALERLAIQEERVDVVPGVRHFYAWIRNILNRQMNEALLEQIRMRKKPKS